LGTCTKTAASIRRAYRAKGGRRDALAINPQTAARLRVYLEASGHGADIDEPLFRPLKNNDKRQEERRGMDSDAIGSALRKYTGAIPGFYAVRMSLLKRHNVTTRRKPRFLAESETSHGTRM